MGQTFLIVSRLVCCDNEDSLISALRFIKETKEPWDKESDIHTFDSHSKWTKEEIKNETNDNQKTEKLRKESQWSYEKDHREEEEEDEDEERVTLSVHAEEGLHCGGDHPSLVVNVYYLFELKQPRNNYNKIGIQIKHLYIFEYFTWNW